MCDELVLSCLASQHFSESDANFFKGRSEKHTRKEVQDELAGNVCDSLWFLGLLPRHDEDSTVANVLLGSCSGKLGVFKQALAWGIN